MRQESGFTLIELLIAMAVFGFLLMIVTVGFINVMRLHNSAIASHTVQDSARGAMESLVQSVRNANTAVIGASGTNSTLCLNYRSGGSEFYSVVGGVLRRWNQCVSPVGTGEQITSSNVVVNSFVATQTTVPPGITNFKPTVTLNLVASSSNGSTIGSGTTLQCKNTPQDRAFCAIVNLTSTAVTR